MNESELLDEAREWLSQTDGMIRDVDTDMQKFRTSIGKLAKSYGRARALIRELVKIIEEK